MSAVMEESQNVKLPGSSFAPTVGAASDDQLRECLERDLEHIAAVLAQYDVSPTEAGLAPQSWHDAQDAKERSSRSRNRNWHNIVAVERRVQAVRAELEARKERRKQEVKEQRDAARRRLEGIIENAAKHDAALRASAEQRAAAWAVIEPWAKAFEVLGGTQNVAAKHADLRRGVTMAAEALGVEPPQIDPLPKIPSADDVEHAIYILRGARKGFDDITIRRGDAAKVDRILQDYK